jgi:hypothetical protein
LFASDILLHKQTVKRSKNKKENKENGGAEEQKGIKE